MELIRKKTRHTSGEIAKERALLTVSADRMDSDPELLLQMQREIASVLSKYMDTSDNRFEVRLKIVYRMKRGILDAKTIQIK